jgi:hypothetical protein
MRTVTGAPTLEKQFRVVARTFDRQLTELKVRAGVMQQNLSESDLVQEPRACRVRSRSRKPRRLCCRRQSVVPSDVGLIRSSAVQVPPMSFSMRRLARFAFTHRLRRAVILILTVIDQNYC